MSTLHPQHQHHMHPAHRGPPGPPPPSQSHSQSLNYSQPPQRRPVARHACLSCREKKIKCDGEIRPSAGEITNGEFRHQRCSNCSSLGIECIFVRSQRGGRRKKDQNGKSKQPSSVASTSAPESSFTTPMPTTTNTSVADSTPGSPTFSSIRRENEVPQSFPSAVTSPFFNNGNTSPILSSRDSVGLQEKVRQLQREAANIQNQLENNSTIGGSSNSSGSQYGDYFLPPPGRKYSIGSGHRRHHRGPYGHGGPHGHGPHGHGGPHGRPGSPSFGMHGGFNQWGGPHHHGPPPHHLRGPPPDGGPPGLGMPPPPPGGFNGPPPPPPPPPPGPLGSFPPPPPHFQQQGGFASHHHHGPPPPPPPPPGQGGPLPPPPNFDKDAQKKRTYSPEFDGFNLPKISKPTNFIKISDEELESFDLPNWRTTCILIDLYYRYVHPSRPFLAPKHRLVYQLQVRQDASLLHAMFSTSCRFASSFAIPNPNLRDPQHWYFLAEKYWDLLDLESSLQALVLLMGSLGPGGYVQQSIEGEERVFKLLKVHNILERLQISNWKEFAEVATKKQVTRYEDMLRTIWGSWKLNVFIRINRGFPFDKISDNLLPFLPDMAFPVSDTQFNMNLSLFDTNDNRCISQVHYKSYREIEQNLAKAAIDPSTYKEFNDSSLIILAIKMMEDVMDTISAGYLTSSTIQEFNSKLTLLENIANSSLYQLSHIKKKMIIINISKIFALLIISVAKLVTNVSQCSEILLIKPHQTNANANPDLVFNSLYDAKLEDIHAACAAITADRLQHYITAFLSAIDAVRLIEIGLGKVKEASDSSVPFTVIGGPLNFTPASEISSLRSHENWWTDSIQEPGKTMSAQVQTYNEFPDVWLQYPIFSIVLISSALTVLSSTVVLTKTFSFKPIGSENGKTKVQFTVANAPSPLEIVLDDEVYATFKENFNIIDLQDKIRLCAKYVQSHGRFWPYVESIANEAEAIINYIDDISSRL